jgi:hypothetical protein
MAKGDYSEAYDVPVDDSVTIYRRTPIATTRSYDVMAAIQGWWDTLPARPGDTNETLTWKADHCDWELTIKSSDE